MTVIQLVDHDKKIKLTIELQDHPSSYSGLHDRHAAHLSVQQDDSVGVSSLLESLSRSDSRKFKYKRQVNYLPC